MTDLRQRLHETLDDQRTDLAVLATRAQTLGTRIRRRRRLTVATGSVAAVAVVAAGVLSVAQLLPGPVQPHRDPGFASQDALVPADGRSVTAALYAAVSDLANGTGDQFTGGIMAPMVDDDTGKVLWQTVSGAFAFTPVGAAHAGEVSVSVSHRLRHSQLWDKFNDGCPQNAVDCRHTQLADGSTVVFYRWHNDQTPDGDSNGGDTVVATREIDDIKIAVVAHNGIDSEPLEGRDLPNLPSAVLTADQVIAIASGDWGLELPSDLAGTELPSFTLLPGGAGSL